MKRIAKPEFLNCLLRDVKELSLSHLKEKYSTVGPASPKFVETVANILNDERVINFNDLLNGETAEIVTDVCRNQFPSGPKNRDQSLRLLIHLTDSKRKEKGSRFDAHVLPTRDLTSFLNKVSLKAGDGGNRRLQVMTRSVANHYTGLDLELKDGSWQCFIMDGADSDELEGVFTALEEAGVERIFKAHCPNVKGRTKLQVDTESSLVFSFDHIIQSSKNEALFDFLEESEQNTLVSWLDHKAWPNAFFANLGLFTMEKARVLELACRSR
ncbi:MAG: hypothetical protein ACI9S8_001941 [Chlamydiales bacterium]|jgi:hypothetical protein